MADTYFDYEQMLRSFRCQDLANLLAYAGQSKNGKKVELLERCINILKKGNVNIQSKIKEIHNLRPQSGTPYGTFISSLNANSNSSASSSPDPNMNHTNLLPNVNRYQPHQFPNTYGFQNNPALHMNMHLPGTNFNPSMTNHSHTHRSMHHTNMTPNNIRVQFETLAFYNLVNEVVHPVKMIPTQPNQRLSTFWFTFCMNPEQISQITSTRELIQGRHEYFTQIHLRFGFYESKTQVDTLPPNLAVLVNGKPAALPTPKPTSKPNADVIRPGRTIDITSVTKLAPVSNRIEINWTNPDLSKIYCVGVYIFKKVSVADLIKNLRENFVKSADFTRNIIKQKLQISDSDLEIETTTYKVSLLCPLIKCRIQIPARSLKCQHAQCFNLESYLQMNEKKPTWNCPVCDQHAPYSSLIIDSLFNEMLDACKDVNELEFTPDGEWHKINAKEKSMSSKSENIKNVNEQMIDDDDDDDDDDQELKSLHPNKKTSTTDASSSLPNMPLKTSNSTNQLTKKPSMEFIDLTVDSDEEDEKIDDQPNAQTTKTTSDLNNLYKSSAQPTTTNDLSRSSSSSSSTKRLEMPNGLSNHPNDASVPQHTTRKIEDDKDDDDDDDEEIDEDDDMNDKNRSFNMSQTLIIID